MRCEDLQAVVPAGFIERERLDCAAVLPAHTRMIHVLATIEVQPGQRAAFLAEFHALRPLVLAEHGCLEYGPAVDCPTDIPVQARLGDDAVTVIEKWLDVPALEAHLKAPHMADYRVKVRPFVKGVTLRVLQPA